MVVHLNFDITHLSPPSIFAQINIYRPPGPRHLQPGGGCAWQLAGHQVGAHHERVHQERRPHALDQVQATG